MSLAVHCVGGVIAELDLPPQSCAHFKLVWVSSENAAQCHQLAKDRGAVNDYVLASWRQKLVDA